MPNGLSPSSVIKNVFWKSYRHLRKNYIPHKRKISLQEKHRPNRCFMPQTISLLWPGTKLKHYNKFTGWTNLDSKDIKHETIVQIKNKINILSIITFIFLPAMEQSHHPIPKILRLNQPEILLSNPLFLKNHFHGDVYNHR